MKRPGKVAIVGSRVPPRDACHALVDVMFDLPAGTVVVSGGAPGIDRLAATLAQVRAEDLGLIEHLPDYRRFSPKRAPLERNTTIAEECDSMLAFTDGSKGGTYDAIRKADALGKRVTLYPPYRSPR